VLQSERLGRLCLVLAIALLLPACLSSHNGVPQEVLVAVTLALKAAKSLKFSNADITKADRDELTLPEFIAGRISEDRHKGYFAYRRAEVLGLANPAWVSESSHATLINRVTADFEEVAAFVTEVIAADHLDQLAPDGTTASGPEGVFRCGAGQHLDLNDVAKFTTDRPVNLFTVEGYMQMRQSNTLAIIWRAAALHSELWNEGASSNRLKKDKLKELLNRRLRLVERAAFQVNGGNDLVITGTAPRGPWKDGARVRMFEYPFIVKGQVDTFTELLGPTPESFWKFSRVNPADATSTIFRANYRKGYGSDSGKRVTTTRFKPEPTSVSPVWDAPLPKPYYRTFKPSGGKSLGDAVDELMTPELDWWNRTWLYCDHVVDVLHLDALRFALKRSGNDAIFTGIPSETSVVLRPPLAQIPSNLNDPQVPDRQTLFIDGADAVYYENSYVPPEKFQVGDQVVFWNHVLYTALHDGAFRLENAIISRVESDPLTGGIRPVDLAMEGHGMTSLVRREIDVARLPGLASYARAMARDINLGLENLRDHAATVSGSKFITPHAGDELAVIKWKPYDDVTVASGEGPWFIFIPRENRWEDIESMLRNIHLSVLNDPSPGSGYQPPNGGNSTIDIVDDDGDTRTFDLSDGVFFPLYVPISTEDGRLLGWRSYFQARRDNPSTTYILQPFKLEEPDVRDLMKRHEEKPDLNPPVDDLTSDIPGLFIGGEKTLPVQVLRPKVRGS
jgi:hypothetical protein